MTLWHFDTYECQRIEQQVEFETPKARRVSTRQGLSKKGNSRYVPVLEVRTRSRHRCYQSFQARWNQMSRCTWRTFAQSNRGDERLTFFCWHFDTFKITYRLVPVLISVVVSGSQFGRVWLRVVVPVHAGNFGGQITFTTETCVCLSEHSCAVLDQWGSVPV